MTCPWLVSGTNVYYTGGNVGVGTSTPGYTFDISGRMNVTWTSPAAFNSPFNITHIDPVSDYTMIVNRTVTRTSSGLALGFAFTSSVNANAGGEWAVVGTVRQNATSTLSNATRVGVDAQAIRASGTSGGLFWGATIEANDESSSSTGTWTACEFDLRGPGSNTDAANRNALQIINERQSGTGTFHAGTAIQITSSPTGPADWQYGIRFQNAVFSNNAIDISAAGIGSGVAINMTNGQRISFDSGTSTIYKTTSSPYMLRYDVSGNTKFSIDDNGWIGGAGYNGSAVLRIGSAGDHKLTTGLDGSGNIQFYVDDSLKKTFVIPHPLESERWLVHATLEGPEAGVYYRGVAVLKEGIAEILLPNYFSTLADESTATVHLTPIFQVGVGTCSATLIQKGKFTIHSSTSCEQRVFWMVMAERRDGQRLVVEPSVGDVIVKGDGPYRYIAGARRRVVAA